MRMMKGSAGELKEHFAGQGFAVTACEAWEDNEAKLKEADLILLDIQLGAQNGVSLCRKIREESAVPILFVTCRDSEQDELTAIRAGGDDFIRKSPTVCLF